jgi:hypothetical protein
VSCSSVRDRLAERSLGILGSSDAVSMERHLQWCAACRKEADELDGAAAVLAYATAPATPAPELEDHVASAVQQRASRGHHGHGAAARRSRLAVAAVAAAMVAVLGLSWGAVMAGKAARSAEIAQRATQNQATVAARFELLLQSLPFHDPKNQVLIGRLAPSTGTGGGSAITLMSPTIMDMSVVMLSQLPPPAAHTLPYEVRLQGPRLPDLLVGKIARLDSGGNAIISHNFTGSLAGYERVVVRDAKGKVILSGDLGTRASLASPSP